MKTKRQKIIGPKFREYFMLHVKTVLGNVIGGLILGLFAGRLWDELDERTVFVGTLMIVSFNFQLLTKLCSRMLYQREAYLYQSFPVSHFETALTKTVVTAMTPATMIIPASVMMYGLKGLMMIPAIAAGSLLVAGIILAAIGFGNSMRDSRAKKPSTWGSLIAAAVMLGAQVGLTAAFIKWVPLSFGLKTLILTAVFAAEAAGMLWYNTDSLKRNYQV